MPRVNYRPALVHTARHYHESFGNTPKVGGVTFWSQPAKVDRWLGFEVRNKVSRIGSAAELNSFLWRIVNAVSSIKFHPTCFRFCSVLKRLSLIYKMYVLWKLIQCSSYFLILVGKVRKRHGDALTLRSRWRTGLNADYGFGEPAK